MDEKATVGVGVGLNYLSGPNTVGWPINYSQC